MTINSAEYKINIQGLQNAVRVIHPEATLTIGSHYATLQLGYEEGYSLGKIVGIETIAERLDEEVERFFEGGGI